MAEPAQQYVPFRVRPLDARQDSERGFVAATWVRCYLSAPSSSKVEQQDYFSGQSRLVTRILERNCVLVAESTSHPVLFGWIAAERDDIGPVVHYVYVKKDYRMPGMDVGRALVVAALKRLGLELPERAVHRTRKREARPGTLGREHWESSLACGHQLRTAKPVEGMALCGWCAKERVRYSHAKAPGMHWANAIGWRYDPYPAYF